MQDAVPNTIRTVLDDLGAALDMYAEGEEEETIVLLSRAAAGATAARAILADRIRHGI